MEKAREEREQMKSRSIFLKDEYDDWKSRYF